MPLSPALLRCALAISLIAILPLALTPFSPFFSPLAHICDAAVLGYSAAIERFHLSRNNITRPGLGAASEADDAFGEPLPSHATSAGHKERSPRTHTVLCTHMCPALLLNLC